MSDIELDIEFDNKESGALPALSKDFLKQLKKPKEKEETKPELGYNLEKISENMVRPQKYRDDVDKLFKHHQIMHPFACKLTLEDIAINCLGPSQKIYQIQIMRKGNEEFGVLCKWGIASEKLDHSYQKFQSAEQAQKFFKEVFKQKTMNKWEDRENFNAVNGGYQYMSLKNLSSLKPDESKEKPLEERRFAEKLNEVKQRIEFKKSNLPYELAMLLKELLGVQTADEILSNCNIDKTKLPMEKIDSRLVVRAFQILAQIEVQLLKTTRKSHHVFELSSKFSELIPQMNQRSSSFLIDDILKLRQKFSTVCQLRGVVTYLELIKELDLFSGNEFNPIDNLFPKLKTTLVRIPNQSEERVKIEQGLVTHGKKHSRFDLNLRDLYRIEKEDQRAAFWPFRKLNRKLLWHGDTAINITSKIKNGIDIFPGESPDSGNIFGKAIYFTDVVSKAALYCSAGRLNTTGFMLLCDVAVGTSYNIPRSKIFKRPPKGFHSVKGVGKFASKTSIVVDGAEFCVSEPVKNDEEISELKIGESAFNYNEYAIYDVSQIKIAYLVQVDFKFK